MTPRYFPRLRSAKLSFELLLVMVLVGGVASASDPPHWTSASLTIDCTTQCHLPHSSLGSALTSAASNVNLCLSCHNPSGLAAALPISQIDKAIPGTRGTSHAFDVPSTHVSLGTLDPQGSEMLLRVMGGNIVCSTCHNQHRAEAATRGTPKVSVPTRLTAVGSTGALVSGGTFTGSQGTWYLVEITQAGNQGTAKWVWSADNGGSWSAEQTAGVGVALGPDGATLTFGAGSFSVGERWELYASWPFLRAALDLGNNTTGDAFCRDCHRSWVMDHNETRTWDGSPKGHPVGVSLNANGGGYDRSTPLDGNGAIQGSGGADANASNDLSLDGGGLVQCISCHGVHYADSNTLTEDVP